jgi:hypothetical protein
MELLDEGGSCFLLPPPSPFLKRAGRFVELGSFLGIVLIGMGEMG